MQQIRLPKIGHGFDVHKIAPKFDESKPLKLGGVEIADRITLEAHSDGDVVLHAVCDALLGAIGEGDIGEHFPDSDPKYKNICSSALLSYVSDMVNKKRFDVGNLDITIVAETPRMHVYKHGIRENISKALKIKGPVLIDLNINPLSRVEPKIEYGKPLHDMSPALPKKEILNNMKN